MRRRVVVTGASGISPIGNDWAAIEKRLRCYRNAVMRMIDWSGYDGLNTELGAPAAEFALSERYTTKATRSMGRVALMATRASELALAALPVALWRGDFDTADGHLAMLRDRSEPKPASA